MGHSARRLHASSPAIVVFLSLATVFVAPAAAHNVCFYECSVFANAPSDCLRTWYVYSETDFCDSDHKFDSVLRVSDLDGLPSFANSSACDGLSSAQVYGALATSTQHGEARLDQLSEKDYNGAAYDEYIGWLDVGREQSKCIKWSPNAETYGAWISDETGVPVYASCWERLSCSNAFGFDLSHPSDDAPSAPSSRPPARSPRKVLRRRGKKGGSARAR